MIIFFNKHRLNSLTQWRCSPTEKAYIIPCIVDWILWSDMMVYAVVSLFSCDSPCCINILLFGSTSIIYFLLFTFIFFHPHNFYFFYPNKKFQIKYLKFKICHNFKFPHLKKIKPFFLLAKTRLAYNVARCSCTERLLLTFWLTHGLWVVCSNFYENLFLTFPQLALANELLIMFFSL